MVAAGTALSHAIHVLPARSPSSMRSSLAFLDEVIRHGHGLVDPAAFCQLAVESKETRTRGWVYLPMAPHLAEQLTAMRTARRHRTEAVAGLMRRHRQPSGAPAGRLPDRCVRPDHDVCPDLTRPAAISQP
jgi:hypothetical protein